MEFQPANFRRIDTVPKWEGAARDRTVLRLWYARGLKIPHLTSLQPHDGRVAIVGAAPSVFNYLDEIKSFRSQNHNNAIFSLNGAHKWLIENGIVPDAQVLFEHDLREAKECLGGEPHKDVIYYICSHCDSGVFDSLKDHHRVLWHCFNEPPEYQQKIGAWFPGEFMIGGSHVTFFRTLNIAIALGFKNFDLFGIDNSFDDLDNSHVPGYHNKTLEDEVKVWVGKTKDDENMKSFKTVGSMAFNAKEFMLFCGAHFELDQVHVHGDGLMAELHKGNFPEKYQ